MKRVVIVDDSPAYCDLWCGFLGERYGDSVAVEAYSHPYDALPKIDDRPFPVGFAEFPRTVLPARDGVPHGGVKRSAPFGTRMAFGD